MFDIIAIGTATRDGFFEKINFIRIKNKRFRVGEGICFPFGSKVEVPKVTFTTGGGATNTAVTFSRQGLKTAIICRVGKDVSGEEVIRGQKKEGIDTRFIQIDPDTSTAYSVIFLDFSGERTILSYKGCGEELSEKNIPWSKIKTKWFFISSLGGKEKLLRKIFDFAKKNKIFIAANPGARELAILKKNISWLNNYDIFILNQEEASYLTDTPYKKEKVIFEKLDKWVKGIVVMTKGPEGVVVSDGRTRWQAGIFPEKKIRDRTGAGDAFASGFVSVFVKNSSLITATLIEEAICLGSANATKVVEYIGAKTGILTKEEINDKRWRKTLLHLQKVKY